MQNTISWGYSELFLLFSKQAIDDPSSNQFRDPPTYTHQPSMQPKVPFSLIRCSSSKGRAAIERAFFHFFRNMYVLYGLQNPIEVAKHFPMLTWGTSVCLFVCFSPHPPTRLTHWLIDCLIKWMNCCLIDWWFIGWLVDWLIITISVHATDAWSPRKVPVSWSHLAVLFFRITCGKAQWVNRQNGTTIWQRGHTATEIL